MFIEISKRFAQLTVHISKCLMGKILQELYNRYIPMPSMDIMGNDPTMLLPPEIAHVGEPYVHQRTVID